MCYDAPCEAACPAHVAVSTFARRIRFQDFGGALRKIVSANVFAGTCGSTCPKGMLCEEACVLRPAGRPILIRDIQRSAFLFGRSDLPGRLADVATDGARKVAVVGSGPAGLACAYYLRSAGTPVTVFERDSLAGGMLARGIPAYRLDPDVVRAEIEFATRDVEVKTDVPAEQITLDGLEKEGFAAVFLATGLWKTVPITIEGSDLEGVLDGTRLLERLARRERAGLPRRGRVAVVGGGNTACDVAVCLARDTDCEVTVYYRRTRAEMPAFPREVNEALAEGVRFEFLAAPVAVEGKTRVERLVLRRMKLGKPDASGRPRPVPVERSDFAVPCDYVIFATGGTADTDWLRRSFGIEAGKDARVAVNPETFQTSVPVVFAGGDLVRPQGLVVEAVADGRRAAAAIRDYLGAAK